MERLLMFAVIGGSLLMASAAKAQPSVMPAAPGGDVLLFAGESLQMLLAPGWQAVEVPYGREVRLVLLPPGAVWQPNTPDSIWICHHLLPQSANEAQAMRELADLNQRRLRMVVGQYGAIGEVQTTQLGDWPAVVQEFVIASESVERRGHHLSCRTPWGIVEIHFGTGAAQYAQRLQDYQGMLSGLRLQPPAMDRRPPLEHVQDAAAILGSWKAYRSRLRLSPEGQVQLLMDPTNFRALDASPSSQILQGEFSARGDLLFIRWSDGSLLNYRWRLHGQELLLTDHHGQPSRLQPLLD